MPDINVNDVNKAVAGAEKVLREGAYVTVGLGVLAFQRAQVRRRELAKRIEKDRATIESQWSEGRSGLTAQLNEVAAQLSSSGERLTSQLGEVGRSVGVNVDTTRAQLLDLARAMDERSAPARRQLDQQIDTVGAMLPAGARDVLEAVRSAVAGPEARLRAAVGLA
jgi:isopropylmalate/homocitrate/citramalate synthase